MMGGGGVTIVEDRGPPLASLGRVVRNSDVCTPNRECHI